MASMGRMKGAMMATLLVHAARARCGARGGGAERGLAAAWASRGPLRRVATSAGGGGDAAGGSGDSAAGGGSSPEERLLSVLGTMRVEVRGKRPPPLRPPGPPTDGAGQRAAPSRPVPPPLAAAARAVARDVPGPHEETESELLEQLRQHESQSDAARRGDLGSLSDIISAMRVSRKSSAHHPSQPMSQIRFDEDWQGFQSRQHKREANEELVQRFNKRLARRHLNIFKELPRDAASDEQQQQQQASGPTLWELELNSAVAAAVSHAPRNGFEEMIQWTEEGKLWLYPVDNEQGLEEEAAVPFHEHVFLERHLAEFPSTGPVRHFMQLVATGLSKNPYLTVAQKHEHIAWFHDYFEKKRSILESVESA